MVDNETDEWPKPWSEIKDGSTVPNGVISFSETWMEYPGGVRGYKDTLYINIDAGEPTDDNRDLWLPFGMYLRNGGETQ